MLEMQVQNNEKKIKFSFKFLTITI